MFQPQGLYGHIRANNFKSALLLAAFVVLGWGVWYSIILMWQSGTWMLRGIPSSALATLPPGASLEAVVWAMMKHAGRAAMERWYVPLIGSTVWFAIAYVFQASLIRASTGAHSVTRKEEPRLYNIIENVAIAAGLPMPQVEIIESRSLNAYAAGLSPDDATVAVTRGLLKTLDDAELEAVIAHEITHILNRDVRLSVIASIFAGGLTLIGELLRNAISYGPSAGWRVGQFGSDGIDDFIFGSSDHRQPATAAGLGGLAVLASTIAILISILMLGMVRMLAVIIRFAISRSREYLADAGAVELTKNPDAMISALLKISGRSDMHGVPSLVQPMMICNAVESDWLDWLYATHPSIDDRVKHLVEFAGGRVPTKGIVHPPQPASLQSGDGAAGVGPWAGAQAFAETPRQFGRRRKKRVMHAA